MNFDFFGGISLWLSNWLPLGVSNTDELAIATESLEEVKKRLYAWNLKFVKKSRKVKVSNTKFLISSRRLNIIKELLIKFPYSIDLKDVGVNSLHYSNC